MCDACNIGTDQPAEDSHRWVSIADKSPGARPRLWVKTESGVYPADNDGTTITVDGVAVVATHWMLR